MIRALILLIGIAITGYCYAQTTISGHVEDEIGAPLFAAKIRVGNSDEIKFTDENGYFSIIINHTPTLLEFSYLGYETTIILIDEPEDDQINVTLNPNPRLLNPITVSSEKVQEVYTPKNVAVIDYDFYDDLILALVKEKSSFYIRLNTITQKTVSEKVLNFRPTGIFKDYMNQFHIASKDSLYLFNFNQGGINIIPEKGEKLYEALKTCVAASESHFFYARFTDFNQSVSYSAYNRKTQERFDMHRITDVEKAEGAQYYYNKTLAFSSTAPVQEIYPDSDDPQKDSDSVKEWLQNVFWFELIMTQETFNPMVQVRDSLYIFNYQKSQCHVFNNQGVLNRSFSVDHHEKKGWQKRVLVDYESEKTYTTLNNRGMTTLIEIDLNTGETLEYYTLSEHSFPDHIKIRNNYAYYLYRDKEASGFYKLYRQPLFTN